jgi:hypothetical protein
VAAGGGGVARVLLPGSQALGLGPHGRVSFVEQVAAAQSKLGRH